MKATDFTIKLALDFNQVVNLIKQLPYAEKLKLTEVLKNETKQPGNDKIMTHLASEKVLSKDWLLPEEDEVWKDL